jgi:hypothetical protein
VASKLKPRLNRARVGRIPTAENNGAKKYTILEISFLEISV